MVSDERGDIEASPTDPTGLFSFDTRFLSRWILTVDGERLNALSVDDLQYFETRFFLVPGTGTVYVDAKLSVIRTRSVGDGFHEVLTIFNHADEPVDLRVRMEAAADFADLFEVKDALAEEGVLHTGSRQHGSCWDTTARPSAARRRSPPTRAESRRERADLQLRHRAEAQWSDRDRRRHAASSRRERGSPRPSTAAATRAPAEHGDGARTGGSHEAPSLVCDWEPLQADVQAQPGRSGGAAVLAADRAAGAACPRRGCPGS